MAMLRNYGVSEIDGKTIFTLWSELGSLYKVSEKLFRDGMSFGGNPPNKNRLSRIAWKYALSNYDEALEILRRTTPVSDLYWEQLMVRKSYQIFASYHRNRAGFHNWLKERGLYDKYKDYRYKRNYVTKDGVEKST
jgi:hypothetical protein